MFDARAFLKAEFQTPANVEARLKTYGLTAPRASAVEKWMQRNSIPSEYLALLLCVKEFETGSPVSLSSYLTGGS
jgi:hypothetical protein